jgi:hypothetical protein
VARQEHATDVSDHELLFAQNHSIRYRSPQPCDVLKHGRSVTDLLK